jgi:hypothetical protein
MKPIPPKPECLREKPIDKRPVIIGYFRPGVNKPTFSTVNRGVLPMLSWQYTFWRVDED